MDDFFFICFYPFIKQYFIHKCYCVLTDKPEIKSITQNPYKVSEGNTAVLQCALTAANPITNIIWEWVKNDGPATVLSQTSNYTISYSIQRTMSGSYNCTAMNTVGTSAATVIKVDVQCKCIHMYILIKPV